MVSLAPFCQVIYMWCPKDVIQLIACGANLHVLAAVHIGYTNLRPAEFSGYSCSPWFPDGQFYEKGNVTLLLQRFEDGHTSVAHLPAELRDPE